MAILFYFVTIYSYKSTIYGDKASSIPSKRFIRFPSRRRIVRKCHYIEPLPPR